MAIDVRAESWIQSGNTKLLILNGSVTDSEIQEGVGIVTTTGTCTVIGNTVLKQGTQIDIYFKTAKKATRRIPRTLKVFSCFADPLRNTTQIEFGCPFAYSKDVQDRSIFTPAEPTEAGFIDQAGNGVTRDPTLRTMPVAAKDVLNTCFQVMGITGVSKPSLQSQFYVDEFDLSAGYFQVASDLMVSERYIISADAVIKDLNPSASSSVVFTKDTLVDISPLGIGGIPGEEINVSYSAIVISADDEEELLCETDFDDDDDLRQNLLETESTSTFTTSSVFVSYTDSNGNNAVKGYNALQSSYTEERYRYITVNPGASSADVLTDSIPQGVETKQVLTQRTYRETTSSAAVLGSYASAKLSAGQQFSNYEIQSETIEKFFYDGDGNEITRTLDRTGGAEFLVGALSVPYSFTVTDSVFGGTFEQFVDIPSNNVFLEGSTVDTYRYGDTVRTVAKRYVPYVYTLSGQQAVAEARDSFKTVGEVNSFIAENIGGKYLLDVTVSYSKGGEAAENVTPSDKELLLEEAGVVEPERDTFNTLEGGEGGIRVIGFNLPYAPDDIIFPVVASSPPTKYCYKVIKAAPSAQTVAKNYGNMQNKILQGYRNGVNIITAPDYFMPVFGMNFTVSANGFAGTYLVNGTTWTLGPEGVVVGVDGLAIGTAGALA